MRGGYEIDKECCSIRPSYRIKGNHYLINQTWVFTLKSEYLYCENKIIKSISSIVRWSFNNKKKKKTLTQDKFSIVWPNYNKKLQANIWFINI